MGHQTLYPKSVYTDDNDKRRRMEHQKGERRNMKQDISTYLPLEIITEILLRLPVQTILRCKCVCKSWRHLLETRDFAKSYHSNSLVPAGIALASDSYIIDGSVDGLLLLIKYERPGCTLYVYNPITREYIDLLHSQLFDAQSYVFGFGVSKITGQYKVVGVFAIEPPKVYTIGTGSWRSIAQDTKFGKNLTRGPFVNENLHWIVKDEYYKFWISCFDLETEIFSDFSPPFEIDDINTTIVAMEDTLCVCVYTHRFADQISIWLMKEYGVENSWTRQFIIKRNIDIWNDCRIWPIKFCKDGIILLSHGKSLYYYFSEDGEITKVNCNFQGYAIQVHSFTPNFLSPDCFKMENSSHLDFSKLIYI